MSTFKSHALTNCVHQSLAAQSAVILVKHLQQIASKIKKKYTSEADPGSGKVGFVGASRTKVPHWDPGAKPQYSGRSVGQVPQKLVKLQSRNLEENKQYLST